MEERVNKKGKDNGMRNLTGNIRKTIQNNWISIFISIIYILVYIVNEVTGDNVVFHALSGSGFKKLNGEVYRIITASFLHTNLLHLSANIIALVSACYYLERMLGLPLFYETIRFRANPKGHWGVTDRDDPTSQFRNRGCE